MLPDKHPARDRLLYAQRTRETKTVRQTDTPEHRGAAIAACSWSERCVGCYEFGWFVGQLVDRTINWSVCGGLNATARTTYVRFPLQHKLQFGLDAPLSNSYQGFSWTPWITYTPRE